MNNMLKRLLSLAMAIVMVMSYVVMPASAETMGDTPVHVHTWQEGVCSDETCNAVCGHEDTTVADTATCVDAGIKTTTCNICGDVVTEESAAKGHSYSDGNTSRDATCQVKGELEFTCHNCGNTYTEETTYADHAYVDGKCGVCGEADPNYEAPSCDKCTMVEGQHAEDCIALCDGTENCAAFTHTQECYWGPCTLTEGCELVKNHLGECTGMSILVDVYAAKIGNGVYSDLAGALTDANAMTGDVTVEIYAEVEFTDGMELNGDYASIHFVGKSKDAKITINQSVGGDYLEAHDKTVSFENLTLAKANPAWSGNSGHMGNYFSIQGGTITYTDCVFPNGACANTSTATYKNCTFQNSSEYGLWVYDDALVTVEGGSIDSVKGIKVYSEGETSVTSTLTVKNATFTANVTDKPAVAIGYAEKVELIGNTYNNTTGVLELDSGSDADCEGIDFVAKDAQGNDISKTLTAVDRSNGNARCGVLVDGKIYTAMAKAQSDITSESTVTLLCATEAEVELPIGAVLDTNGYAADNVTFSPLDTMAELKIAIAAGGTITLDGDITLTEQIETTKPVVLDLNSKTITGTTKHMLRFGADATVKNGSLVNNSTVSSSSCVNTRANIALVLTNVKLTATGTNSQPLTIGGTTNGTTAVVTDCVINAGTTGYGIICYVDSDIDVTGGSVSGYAALYTKEGSAGSEVTFTNCALSGSNTPNVEATNDFGTIVLEAPASVTVSGGSVSAISSTNDQYIVGIKATGNGSTVNLSGTTLGLVGDKATIIGADVIKNTVNVSSDYTNQLEAEGYKLVAGKVSLPIKTEEALAYALSQGGTVILEDSFEVTDTLEVPANVTLDLAGHTISGDLDGVFDVSSGATLTVTDTSAEKDGKIKTTNANGDVIAVNGTLNLKAGTLEGQNYCVTIYNNASFVMDNGVVKGYFAVYTARDGASFTMNGGAVTGAVAGNGSMEGSTTIEINNGTITDDSEGGVAIYHPQNGTVTITGGTLTGADTGIEMRSGTLVVKGGTIIGKGDPASAGSNESGTTLVGAGVGISQHTTNNPINVTIQGGTLQGVYAFREVDVQDDDNSNVVLSITNGNFTGKVESQNVSGFITGGKFNTDVNEYVAVGYEWHEDGSVGEIIAENEAPTVDTSKTETEGNDSTTADKIIESISTNDANKDLDTNIDAEANKTAVENATTNLVAQAAELEAAAKKADADATVTLTDVKTTVDIDVTNVAASTEGTKTTVTITYDVAPMVTGTVTVTTIDNSSVSAGVKETKIEEPLHNDDIKEEIFFHLPVPSGIKGIEEGTTVHVKHIHEGTTFFYVKQVQKDTKGHLYIEMSADKFSNFIVEFVDENAPKNYQAGNYTFETFEQAYAYAKTSGANIIKVLQDAELDSKLVIDSTITLDLNGFALASHQDDSVEIVKSGKLTIKDSTAKMESLFDGTITVNGGTFTMESGRLGDRINPLILMDGTANIKGGTVYTSVAEGIAVVVNGGTLNVSGGRTAGDAVGIIANSNAAEINITNGEIYGTTVLEITGGTAKIYGGEIDGALTGNITVYGLTKSGAPNPAVFTADPTKFCVEGYYGLKNADIYTIAKRDSIKVNGTPVYADGENNFVNDLGGIIDNTTTGGANNLLDITLEKGNANITGEHAVKNSLKLTIETGRYKISGGGSITSGEEIKVRSICGEGDLEVTLPDGGKTTFNNGSVTYAPRYLNETGNGCVVVSKEAATTTSTYYYLDKDASITVAANGTVTTTGKYIVGDENGPIYTIGFDQNDVYDNMHFLNRDPDMTVTCNGFYGSVKNIWITGGEYGEKVLHVFKNGAAVNGFKVEEGSTVVTLSKNYLNSLEKGDYTIHFQYKDHGDNESESRIFKVRNEVYYNADTTNPKTGDSILMAAGVMTLSAAALVILLTANKKKRR